MSATKTATTRATKTTKSGGTEWRRPVSVAGASCEAKVFAGLDGLGAHLTLVSRGAGSIKGRALMFRVAAGLIDTMSAEEERAWTVNVDHEDVVSIEFARAATPEQKGAAIARLVGALERMA